MPEYQQAYDWDEDRFGNITLTRKADGASVYLQSDDAATFRLDVEALKRVWFRFYGRPEPTGAPIYRRRVGPFNSYTEHFDAIASAYDEVMVLPEDDE